MRKLKLYLETSVWNFFYADDAPDLKQVTHKFFERIESGVYAIHIAEPVLREITAAPQPIRDRLVELVRNYSPQELDENDEVISLAHKYIESGALPPGSLLDALHVAYASFYEMDCVVTWNMRHIAGVRRREKVMGVNLGLGYPHFIDLITPFEVSEDADD